MRASGWHAAEEFGALDRRALEDADVDDLCRRACHVADRFHRGKSVYRALRGSSPTT